MLSRTGEVFFKQSQQNPLHKHIFKAEVSLTLAFMIKNASERIIFFVQAERNSLTTSERAQSLVRPERGEKAYLVWVKPQSKHSAKEKSNALTSNRPKMLLELLKEVAQ